VSACPALLISELTLDSAIHTFLSAGVKWFLNIKRAHCARDLKFLPTKDL
jgi:hypothetical protein